MQPKHAQIIYAGVAGISVIVISIGISYVEAHFGQFPVGVTSPFMYSMSETVKAVGVFIGVPAIVLGLWNYVRGVEQNERSIKEQQLAQIWKRKEFVANNMKDFTSRRTVQLAMQMLDYTVRRIDLFPEEKEYQKRYIRVNRRLLGAALMWHKIENRPRYGPVPGVPSFLIE